MNEKILKYYSRKDIQRAIVDAAKDREVAVRFQSVFGKRPDILQFDNDVMTFASNGATSFHISEERWRNPLNLKPGMTKIQLDSLRKGWDLVLDIDCKFIEYSKACADLLVRAIKFNDVSSYGVKFSGGSGFHISIPFEAFPSQVNNQETRLLFPDGVRAIAEYLKSLIKDHLSEKILSISTIQEISSFIKKPSKELLVDNAFNPFTVINIDAVLISSRHMFRCPYSINEKTNLVSVPVENPLTFEMSKAKMENVSTSTPFFKQPKEEEASQLIIQAFDHIRKSSATPPQVKDINQKRDFSEITTEVSEEHFPPCIKLMMKGLPEDGRKRAVFILTNFLQNVGYAPDRIEAVLNEWNKKNYEELREGYIRSQVSWAKKQPKKLLPPNCDNEAYYLNIGVCKPDGLCRMIKNPVNYVKKKLKILNQNSRKSPRKPRKAT